MSQEQRKSLLEQVSKDHLDQKEVQMEEESEDKSGAPTRQATVSDGYQTDSSMSPTIPFISAVQSPCSSLPPLQQSATPSSSVSEWQDAQSDILVDKENFADSVDGDVFNYPLMTFGMTKRRLSRTPSGSQRSRKVPDLEDIEFPSLDYGPHLKFFPEEYGM